MTQPVRARVSSESARARVQEKHCIARRTPDAVRPCPAKRRHASLSSISSHPYPPRRLHLRLRDRAHRENTDTSASCRETSARLRGCAYPNAGTSSLRAPSPPLHPQPVGASADRSRSHDLAFRLRDFSSDYSWSFPFIYGMRANRAPRPRHCRFYSQSPSTLPRPARPESDA